MEFLSLVPALVLALFMDGYCLLMDTFGFITRCETPPAVEIQQDLPVDGGVERRTL